MANNNDTYSAPMLVLDINDKQLKVKHVKKTKSKEK